MELGTAGGGWLGELLDSPVAIVRWFGWG